MSDLKCLHCGAVSTNGLVLCKGCQQTARSALENITAYHGKLLGLGAHPQVRIKRERSQVADPTGSRATQDDVADPTPADMAAEAKADLVGWARMLLDDRDVALPADGITAIARHLSRYLGSIATLGWAGEFLRQTVALERRMKREIGRHKGRWYAGICSAMVRPEMEHSGMTCACECHNGLGVPCSIDGGCGLEFGSILADECDRELYAEPGQAYLRCPKCHTRHSVTERRAVLLAEARETLLPLSVIARACVSLLDDEPSVERFTKRIRNWTDRGELVWTDHDGGTRLYRVGDVLDLQTRHAADPRGWRKRVSA